MDRDTLVIANSTKGKLPRLPFLAMKDAVLGEGYVLNLSIVSRPRMRALNRQYRGIDKPTDILSFPLSSDEGEMFINLEESKKEAKNFDREYVNFLAFLFLHGLVHLTGLDHGTKMENLEKKFRKRFKI